VSGPAALDAVFGALADPTRRRLLEELVAEGPRSASRLVEGLPISRQGIVKHLQVLEEAGLVTAERSGREVLFRARADALDAGVGWMVRAGAAWDRRLGRLRRSVGRPDT
jgi:DNA-binding transcriptional ArsR family regulator